ncbi:hypothetical protein OG241_01825 [Streptomyces sp. NBC_01390]|uniref:hypothetical protein n=1 Tax=Streptomyces sp. NBC_01390 TaxID=2903850 RepID=UPI0032488B68
MREAVIATAASLAATRHTHHMRDRGLRYGPQTRCEGGGTADATLVEVEPAS